MSGILIVTDKGEEAHQLSAALGKKGLYCAVVAGIETALETIDKQSPDLVLAEVNDESRLQKLCQALKPGKPSVVALVEPQALGSLNVSRINDFVVKPVDIAELVLRMNRLLRRTSSEIISCGDLEIDLAKCEISIEGRPVMLTFKEYELLKFLANHRERVFTRDALLNEVWGYDYYGGDRTVDVHVRRLRSKIEDSRHTFIETVRNIGYRFRNDALP